MTPVFNPAGDANGTLTGYRYVPPADLNNAFPSGGQDSFVFTVTDANVTGPGSPGETLIPTIDDAD